MLTYSEIIDGAKFRGDLVNSDRVSQAEWVALEKDAFKYVWQLCAAARIDFSVRSTDYSVASSAASATLTAQNGSGGPPFYGLIDVVYGPDTQQEYSLGPFAWQNRRAPGSWWPIVSPAVSGGATKARLMGTTIYLEPSIRAGGNYRVWYCPTVKTCDFIVRLATAAALPACTAAGAGVGKTLTANANGALTVDGVAAAAGDRVLVKDQAAGKDNGIYTVTAAGSGGSTWILTRATDYDQAAVEVRVENVIGATEGTANANLFFELLAFQTWAGTLDTDSLIYGPAVAYPELEPFRELLIVRTALPAIRREDDLPTTDLSREQQALESQLTSYLRATRTAGVPAKAVDTDARGPIFPWGW